MKYVKRIIPVLQDPTTTITLYISHSLSPPCRAGFPSIVACETENAAHSAWPAIHSSWTNWWKTIRWLYILLGHSGSPALILDTWTYILGYGGEVKRQKRGWGGNWRIGSGGAWLGVTWSWHEADSLRTSHLAEIISKQWIISEGRDQGGWALCCSMTHWLGLWGEEARVSFTERSWCVYSITSSNPGSHVTHWLWEST